MRASTKNAVMSGLTVVTLMAGVAIANNVGTLVTFQSGTAAKASEVNGNFTAVQTAVNDNYSLIGALQTTASSLQTALTALTTRVAALEAAKACPAQMVAVGTLCVDRYEASVWSNADGTGTQYGVAGNDYPSSFPPNGNWTTKLYAASKPGVFPSRWITWFQAAQACAASGKRLLSNAEWQLVAAGTPNTGCNTNTTVVANTDANPSCVSSWGVYDMSGNVNEFTGDITQGGGATWSTTNRTLSAAYNTNSIYNMNQAQSSPAGFPGVIIRSGDAWQGTNTGIFTMSAGNGPDVVDASLGFRCAR